MPKRAEPSPSRKDAFARTSLEPFVAVVACSGPSATDLRELFEDVACDWRIIRATDGMEVARHVMNKGLPDLLLIGPQLSKIEMPDFVEWIRSFRSAPAVTIVVYGSPNDKETRELLLRSDVSLILSPDCARPILAQHLARVVGTIEKRRFRSFSTC